jgi:hypothetical protein
MKPKFTFTTNAIEASNTDAKAVLDALKNILRASEPQDIIEIGKLVSRKPGAIKKALKFKNYV